MTVVPLRRTPVAWVLLTDACVVVPLGVFSIAYGAAASEVGLIVYGAIVLTVLAWPGMLGATVGSGELVFGWRWRRTRLPTSEIAELHVGRVEHFGFRGGPALGLVVELADGGSVVVPESRFCRRDRLLAWSAAIAERCATPVDTTVHRVPINRPGRT